MAEHNLWKTTDLTPLLLERGINLSSSQVYRLVADQPERLSLRTLAALCDIFECTPNDLIEPIVTSAAKRHVVGEMNTESDAPSTIIRPTRARITE
ncbi:helix-turn-helix domain-containing protein [Plantibacter sp. RU18]